MCKPCTLKCKCKAQCHNPHNNGGVCTKCTPSTGNECDSDDNSEDETGRQTDDEVIPIVPSHHEDIDTESDSNDLEDQDE